jgi:hypothetical protein
MSYELAVAEALRAYTATKIGRKNESVPVLGRETADGLFICVGRDAIADKKIPENTMCVLSGTFINNVGEDYSPSSSA